MSLTLKEKVECGAKFLDEKVPDWFERINPAKLQLSSCHNCMLGQLFGDFNKGWYAIVPITTSESTKHPFFDEVFCEDKTRPFWLDEITRRKEAVPCSF